MIMSGIIINDGWLHEHWEMIVWTATIVVVSIISLSNLVLNKYATKHFVKDSIREFRESVKDTDDDIIRRQEKCSAELHHCIDRLSNQVDKIYIMILDIHVSGTDKDRESLDDWPKS